MNIKSTSFSGFFRSRMMTLPVQKYSASLSLILAASNPKQEHADWLSRGSLLIYAKPGADLVGIVRR
jgi:hypothetical protein